MCLSCPLVSKLTNVNPFPIKEIREIAMGEIWGSGRGGEGNKFDNHPSVFSGCLSILTKQQLFHTHAKINQISRGWFKWAEVKYGPNDTLLENTL